jgi:hypothetical protein
MAPIEQYLVASPTEEIALARSAAPASISGDADVMTLGRQGYETAVHGHNGFVCLVERSWAAALEEPELWNPRLRGPICLNPAAAASVLPGLLERTRWVLAGQSRADIIERTRHAVAEHTYMLPQPGAMGFMLSKRGFLGDAVGHWHPHLMLFMPRIELATWGAGLAGSPVHGSQGGPEPITTCFVVVQQWSDGTPEVAAAHSHGTN